MKIENTPLTKIKPYHTNPRANDDAVDAVAASISQFGFNQPIVVDRHHVIVVGHTRWKAAQMLGLKKVPVYVAANLTEEQAKAYRIADNQTGNLAEWDFDLLSAEILQLEQANYNVDVLGFSAAELAKIAAGRGGQAGFCDEDDVPLPPDKAKTKPGDLYLLGNHRLLCGDSSKPDDVDRLLDGADIHLINTDPPYNVRVEPRSNNAIAAGLSSFPATQKQSKPQQAKKQLRDKDRPLENDFVSDEQFDALLDAWFGNMARVLKPGGSFYIWGGYANLGNYPPFLKKHELYFSQAVIWDKQHPVLTRKDFMGAFEIAFYGWKEGAAHLGSISCVAGPNATDVLNEIENWESPSETRGFKSVEIDDSTESVPVKKRRAPPVLWPFWQTISSSADGCDKFIVIPDGELWRLPFGTLRDPKTDSFLIESYSFVYELSALQLVNTKTSKRIDVNKMLLIGGLDYGSSRDDVNVKKAFSEEQI